MASPQPDEFVRISREYFDALRKVRISGVERQILDTIIAKTWGWNKTEDKISLRQFCDEAGLNPVAVCKAIKKLLTKNLIVKKGNRYLPTYGIQKDYDQWKISLIVKKGKTDCQKRKSVLPKKEIPIYSTIDTKTKDTKTKEKNTLVRQADDAIDFLNEKGNRNFTKSKRNRGFALARLREGMTLHDLKTVVDHKLQDTYFTIDKPELFRPETLFGTKAESYLNAARASPSKLKAQYGKSAIEQAANLQEWVENDDQDDNDKKRLR